MEVPSANDFGHVDFFGSFTPNYFVSIKETWNHKLLALACYKAEIFESPHSRSIMGIEALATLRGHQAGLEKAEVFQILRKIDRS
jgi:hypothetical protein